MKGSADNSPKVKDLRPIPGIGTVLAAAIIGETGRLIF